MEREARRKKITSRETDRMALITGRIQLDPDFAKSSSFSTINPRRDHLPAQHARSSSEPVGAELNDKTLFQDYSHSGGDDVPHQNDEEVHKGNASGSRVSHLQKIDEDEGAPSSSAPASDQSQTQSALVVTRMSNASNDTNFPDQKPFEYHLSSITPREIHFSIISSENTRVVCSFVIAVLVVLSHVNLPHKVIKSKSLIAYRPLYAVLLTDMLIVAARLALYSQGKDDEKEVKLEGDVQSWDGAVKLLEWGLMLHQTLRAIFIDCSLYLSIVICGLSLV